MREIGRGVVEIFEVFNIFQRLTGGLRGTSECFFWLLFLVGFRTSRIPQGCLNIKLSPELEHDEHCGEDVGKGSFGLSPRLLFNTTTKARDAPVVVVGDVRRPESGAKWGRANCTTRHYRALAAPSRTPAG